MVNALLDKREACDGDAATVLRDLRRVAAVRGLGNSALRRRAWPAMLGLPSVGAAADADARAQGAGPVTHRDARVVECDVARSLVHFDDVKWPDDNNATLAKKREELAWMLNGVCSAHPDDVYYYQGLHDIAGVLLLIVEDAALAKALLERLALHHLRDCTRPALDDVLDVLQLVPSLLRRHDPVLADVLLEADVPPHFALSWQLTWFSHGCATLAEAARLFDLLLSGHPLLPLYVGVSAMTQPACRQRILDARRTAAEEDPEHWQSQAMAHMHKALTSLAIPGVAGADMLAREAFALYKRHPPESLDGYARVVGPLSAAQTYPFEGRWRGGTPSAELRRYDKLRARRQKRGDWRNVEPAWLTWLGEAARSPGAPYVVTGAAALGVWLALPAASPPAKGKARVARWTATAGWALAGAAMAAAFVASNLEG